MSEVEKQPAQGTLRECLAYLRKPRLIEPSGLRSGEAWRKLAILFAVQTGVLLAVVAPLMGVWQRAFGLEGPDAFEQLPDGWFLPLTVLIAPVLEELFFRGWLTGRKRALWLFFCALAVAGLLVGNTMELVSALAMGAGFILTLLAAPIGWFVLRKKAEPQWFVKGFPAIFYLVLAAFALMHLSNYGNWSLIAIPLVLPQLWIGTMLGYIRMRIGLPAAILAHISSNSAVLVLTPLFG